MVSVTDTLGGTFNNRYNAVGNLIETTDQTGRSLVKTYDALGRVITEHDNLGNTRRTAYDSAGRVSSITLPNGAVTVNNYDGRGRLTSWVDAEGSRWQYFYGQNSNITNIIDARGGEYTMEYGTRNERVSERNQNGKVWKYGYDKLRRPTHCINPDSLMREVEYDWLGRLNTVKFTRGTGNADRIDYYRFDKNNNLEEVSRTSTANVYPTITTTIVYDKADRPESVETE